MQKDWAEAEHRYKQVAEQHPSAAAAADALYWAGVSQYKISHDHSLLGEYAKQLQKKYPESIWTARASVWAD
jgi:TolA-binding protein